MRKIYISGKVSGEDLEEVREKFERAEYTLRSTFRRAEVVNPMRLHNPRIPKEWEDYMAEDVRALLTCDAIFMLPDWSLSRGARIEMAIARELGLELLFG